MSRHHLWKLTVLVSLLAFPSSVHAQRVVHSAFLSGHIIDAETGAPLPGASVAVPALNRGVAAGSDGRYRLEALPADSVTVRVSFVGYASEERRLDLSSGGVTWNPALSPLPIETGTAEVMADAQRERLTRDVRPRDVLDAEALNAIRGQALGEMLETLNGVTALTTGPSISKPVVRGLHSDRVLVLNNGVRQEGQQWGGEHAPEIDPFAPQRVEVIKGAAGVEHGAGAIGGVIELEDSPLPERPGVRGRVALQGFTNSGQGAASIHAEGASSAIPGMAWRAQVSARRAGDARTPDFVIRNSAFRELSGRVVLGLKRDLVDLEAHLSRYNTELGIYVGSHFGNARNLEAIIERGGPNPDWDYAFSYAIQAPKQAVTHDVASLHAHVAFPTGDALDVQYSFQRNHRREFDAHRPYSDSLASLGRRPSFDLTLFTNTLDAKLTHRPLGRVFGAVGVSGMVQSNENGASGYLIPNFTAVTGGAFAHETWLVTDRFSLEGGLRLDARWMQAWPHDASTRSFSRQTHQYVSVTAAGGALWEAVPGWSAALNAGSAWRPPGVNELYADGVHHGSARFEVGDASLVPERSLDLSLTMRRESDLVSGEANVYANTIRNYIYFLQDPEPTVTIRGTFPTYAATQHDARLIGLDAAAEVRPLASLDVGATLSFLRADNLDLGGPLYGMPPGRFGGRVRVHTNRLGGVAEPYFETEVTHVLRQRRLQEGAYEPAPPPSAYTLTNLRVGAEVPTGMSSQPATLSVSVQNLFNVRYRDYLSRFRYFIDEPGRGLVVRLSVPLGTL